jgi:hypothetical protein
VPAFAPLQESVTLPVGLAIEEFTVIDVGAVHLEVVKVYSNVRLETVNSLVP